MKLIKPDWVSHNGKPMFCIDVHPDGTRFATGGHGEDCGSIIIWNVAPVISPIAESDENVPKILCQMDDHAGCVNCLRWSNSGNYLVSGGDDKMVVVWTLSKNSGSSSLFGSFGSIINIETWKSAHVLRGHLGDVLDVNWSPDDSFIATGSVDNTIIIWNALKFPEIAKTIKGHVGLVKGVVFDPVGKYMASQSDDKTLCIWNVSDWSLEKKIKEPFNEASGTTHVLRLHWSPDGQFIVSAHAMNNGGPVAKIIERNGWKAKKDFVGHRKAITCVRYVCCGIGSRDRSLSIWSTSLKRPLVVVHDLFENSLMDIAWSHCGYNLFVCSLDGTAACLQFSADELGKATSTEEKFIFHKKTFGTSIKSNKSLILSTLEETFYSTNNEKNQVDKESKQTAKPPLKLQNVNKVSNQPSIISPFKGKDKKFSFGSNSIPDASSAKEVLEKQKETKTKDGKRRIVPMMLDAPCDTPVTDVPLKAKPNENTEPTSSSTDVDFISSGKRKQSEGPLVTTPVKKPKKKEKDKSKKPSTPDKKSNEASEENEIQLTSSMQRFISHPDVKDEISFNFNLYSPNGEKEIGLIEVENVSSSQTDASCYLKYYVNESLRWSTVLQSPVTQVSANKYLSCATCANKSLHVFSNNGRRNIRDKCCLVKREKVNPIFSKSDARLSLAYMNESGYPIVFLSDGSSYIYDVALSAWCELSDGDGFNQNEFSTFLHDVQLSGPLKNIQPSLSSVSQTSLRSSVSKQQTAAIAHIESRLCSSLLVNSPEEYRYWLMTYTRYLVQIGDENRLREICEELLHSDNEGKLFAPVKVFREHEILREVLDVLGSDIKFKRFRSEIQQQLDAMT